jgi:hypothetical protein
MSTASSYSISQADPAHQQSSWQQITLVQAAKQAAVQHRKQQSALL